VFRSAEYRNRFFNFEPLLKNTGFPIEEDRLADAMCDGDSYACGPPKGPRWRRPNAGDLRGMCGKVRVHHFASHV
jgi:hypothetical protein